MKNILLLAATFLFLTSCQNTWDSESKDAFRQSCIDDAKTRNISDAGAKTMCDCRLEKAMKKYPNMDDALGNMDKLIIDPEIIKCGEGVK